MTQFRYDLLVLIASHDKRGESGIPVFLVAQFKPASKRAIKWLHQMGYVDYKGGKLVATSAGRDFTEIPE